MTHGSAPSQSVISPSPPHSSQSRRALECTSQPPPQRESCLAPSSTAKGPRPPTTTARPSSAAGPLLLAVPAPPAPPALASPSMRWPSSTADADRPGTKRPHAGRPGSLRSRAQLPRSVTFPAQLTAPEVLCQAIDHVRALVYTCARCTGRLPAPSVQNDLFWRVGLRLPGAARPSILTMRWACLVLLYWSHCR